MITLDLSQLQPYTWSSVPIIALPFALLYVQVYLLLKYGNQTSARLLRVGLLPLGIWGIMRAWLGHRVMTPEYNVFNFGFGCAAVFYIVLLISYSLISTGPHRTNPSTPLIDAFHLLTTPRLIGWSHGLPPNPHPHPHLSPSASRSRFINHQLLMIFYHYLWTDATIYSFHLFGRGGLGLPSGGSVQAASDGWVKTLESWGWVEGGTSSSNDWVAWAVRLSFRWWIGGALGFAFYQALCLGYHICAFLGLVIFRTSPSEWPRLMNQPWRSTSLLEFWGRRWHQIFRQAFTAPIRFIPSHYRSLAAPFFAFFISASMHELATLTLVGHTSPRWKVARSFLSMAFGMTFEILFRRITGKRVRGPIGWIWTWVYFTTATMGLVESWLEFGIGGARLIPTTISLADHVLEPLRIWCFDKLDISL